MSNFTAPTRLKGSDDEYREAIWVDDYFGPHQYGVRFRGTVRFVHGEDCEIGEVVAK